MLPLALLNPGDLAEVIEMNGQQTGSLQSTKECTRISSLGLRAGKKVQLLQKRGTGPYLIRVGDTRIAIDKDLANKIQTRKL